MRFIFFGFIIFALILVSNARKYSRNYGYRSDIDHEIEKKLFELLNGKIFLYRQKIKKPETLYI
jgi:hypothetical protein